MWGEESESLKGTYLKCRAIGGGKEGRMTELDVQGMGKWLGERMGSHHSVVEERGRLTRDKNRGEGGATGEGDKKRGNRSRKEAVLAALKRGNGKDAAMFRGWA